VADDKPVWLRDFEEVIGSNQTARAGHIFDADGGIAGNMFAHMAGNHARVDVVTASGCQPNDDTNIFSFEEIGLSVNRRPFAAE
jgi:hypothetical protein